MSQKPDDQLEKPELIAKLAKAREEFKKLRQGVNEQAARALKAEAGKRTAESNAAATAELLALVRREKADLAEQLAAAGKDSRLIGMLGQAREQVAFLGQVLDAVGQILGGDQPMTNLPDHPLLNTAEEVSTIAGRNVSWARVADRRHVLLDELIGMYDAAGGRPHDNPEWVRLISRIRTELLERVEL